MIGVDHFTISNRGIVVPTCIVMFVEEVDILVDIIGFKLRINEIKFD